MVDEFSISLSDQATGPAEVSIYDMFGKRLEQTDVNLKKINDYSFGKGLQTGVYNVILSFGEQRKSVRVIKR